jgi:hypothetical protein
LDFHIHREQNEVNLAWVKKGEDIRFVEGIDGAFVVVPFQCDICWFRVLENREPKVGSYQDNRILGYIRRVNLDLIWSRAPGTIASIRDNIKMMMKMWRELGVSIDLPLIGPWPAQDKVGFRVALAEVRYSQRPGVNEKTHLQFDTVRKMRTAFSHVFEVGKSITAVESYGFKGMKGDVFTSSSCPTDSRFFQMFTRGLLLRLGRQTRSNWGLDYNVLHAMLKNLEKDLELEVLSKKAKREIVMIGAFMIIGFVCALRGNEIFLVEAEGVQSMIHKGKVEKDPKLQHVVIPLLGRFKNEDGERWHVMLSVAVTDSNLEVRKWTEKLVAVLAEERRGLGPAFCDTNGDMLSYQWVDDRFVKEIRRIQEVNPQLIDSGLDVAEHYSIFRSIRKGSTARVTDMQVDSTTIDLHNRWRTLENRGGSKSTKSMRDYYSDLRLTINSRLAYSRAL